MADRLYEGDRNIQHQYSDTSDDQDKSFTVPEHKIWIMKIVTMRLGATAAAGDRIFRLRYYRPDGQPIFTAITDVAITASQWRTFLFAPHVPPDNAFRNDWLANYPIPEVALPENYYVRCDVMAGANGGDDMIVMLTYDERCL